jgi:hypothetical protein
MGAQAALEAAIGDRLESIDLENPLVEREKAAALLQEHFRALGLEAPGSTGYPTYPS